MRAFDLINGVLLCAATWSTATAQSPAFSNQTAQAGINVIYTTTGYVHDGYTGGGAAADFNNDGWQDVIVLGGGANGLPDRLYINDGTGSFNDEAASWGLTLVHRGKGASVADFNGDGWTDIFITSAGPTNQGVSACRHILYRNNGNGSFTNIATAAGVNCSTASGEDGFGSGWGDYDLDGDLDLFVAGFATNNSGNRLFRNDGNETFTDVTSAAGIFAGVTISMKSFAPRVVDMDGDFFPDLILVSDFGTSRYFRNNANNTFTDVTNSANAGLEENGMGNTVGDYNEDGVLDYYATSIYMPAFNWTGNKLYYNQGNHVYTEHSVAAGVFDGGYGWGAVSVDFNHDTHVDIGETNGDSGGTFGNEQSYLWMSNGNGTYTESALTAGLEHFGRGRGMINFDCDNDGDQDVVIFANNETVNFYRNDLVAGPDTQWLRVFLDSSTDSSIAPNGYGSRVFATFGGETRMRNITTGDNFLSHSEVSAHFGLGTATNVEELRIEWPNGDVTTLTDVASNQTMTVVKGPSFCSTQNYCLALVNTSGTPALISSSGSVDVADNNFNLEISGAGPNHFGLFFYGPDQTQMPFGDGYRCVAPGALGVFRLGPPDTSDALGNVTRPVDLTQPPLPAGLITPGSTWNFQFWYRDPAGFSGFNLSNGLEVNFCL